jgi:hypothetical protein
MEEVDGSGRRAFRAKGFDLEDSDQGPLHRWAGPFNCCSGRWPLWGERGHSPTEAAKRETPTSLEERLGSRYTGAPFVGEAPRKNLSKDDNFVMVEKAAPDFNPFALVGGPPRIHEGPSHPPFRRHFWTDGCHLATGQVAAGRCNKFPSPIASNWGPAAAPRHRIDLSLHERKRPPIEGGPSLGRKTPKEAPL